MSDNTRSKRNKTASAKNKVSPCLNTKCTRKIPNVIKKSKPSKVRKDQPEATSTVRKSDKIRTTETAQSSMEINSDNFSDCHSESILSTLGKFNLTRHSSAPNLTLSDDKAPENTAAIEKLELIELELQSAHDEVSLLNDEIRDLKEKLTQSQNRALKYKNMAISLLKGDKTIMKGEIRQIGNITSSSLAGQNSLIRNSLIHKNSIEIEGKQRLDSSTEASPMKNPSLKKCQYSTRNSNDKPKNIIIIGDQQAKGITMGLRNLLDKEIYSIQGYVKENATFEYVVKEIENLTKNMTMRDHLIIMAGSNDKNPYKLLNELSFSLKKTCNTNLYLTEVLYSNYLREMEINRNFDCYAKLFQHCTMIKNLGDSQIAPCVDSICQRIMHTIQITEYRRAYLTYNDTKLPCTPNSIKYNNEKSFENIEKNVFHQRNKLAPLGRMNKRQPHLFRPLPYYKSNPTRNNA